MPGASADLPTIDGYVADTLYPSNFHQVFQPSWTDWNLERRCLPAPRASGDPFVLVDLGCGDGLGLILTAAAHPHGSFIGLDAMPEHIARGRNLASEAGLTNIAFHCSGFAGAGAMADGHADYVTAQGVLAWISTPNREALLDLAACWLKPGGALTLGYNCLPGWGAIAGFQRLVRAIAASCEGSSTERFNAALERARASGAIDASVWSWFDPQRDRFPPDYFAHEYLNGHWDPCWSGDVIAAMADRGLAFAGQARASELRKDLSYKADWRAAIGAMPDAPSRELASDLVTGNWFRHDLYVKLPCNPLLPERAEQAWLARWWAMVPPQASVSTYQATTMAGEIDFDNPAARAILAHLETQPAPLSLLKGFAPADLINSADALFAARHIIPVDPPHPSGNASRLNRLLHETGQPIAGLAGAHGAIGLDCETIAKASAEDLRRWGIEV